MAGTRFAVDPERVIAEQFDGETVVVNLISGAYFSLRGTAALVWSWLSAGADPSEIARRLDPAEDRGANVTAFVTSLLAEALLDPSDEPAVPLPDEATGPATYVPPSFDKFTDMAELLLLDPIHDVAPMGWPAAAQTEANPPVPAA